MRKLVLTSLIAAAFSFGHAFAEDALELEPSINGEVSKSGLYATQAKEDVALALLSEPCIYGEEAVSSLYTAKIEQNTERNRMFAKATGDSRKNVASAR